MLCAPAAPALADWNGGLAAYESGQYLAALREWAPLAMAGEARAQEMLGYMYDVGEGVPEDDAVAAQWYLLAADQGSSDAQINLALIYASGSGVVRDTVRAYMWLDIAASTSDPALRQMALDARAAVAREMSWSQIEQAQEMARQWRRQ